MEGGLRRVAGHGLRIVQSQGIFRAAGRKVVLEIHLTVASPSDIEQVHKVLNPGVPFRSSPPDLLVTRVVAKRSERVIGFVELVRQPPEHPLFSGFWLFGLHVLDPLYRGFGIGENLVRYVIEIARREGAGELWLVVDETNRPAINLYQKLGFERAIIVGLEERLEDEAGTTGKRRITMANRLNE